MKITKYSKFITASISNSYLADDILFDDVIRVDIEFDFDCIRNYIQSSHQFDKFPGKEQFRQDVINLLEEKYFFDVIEDNYDGKLQKGHFSNREDSISLYIDAYLDLNHLQRLSLDPKAKGLEGRMYCFIHIRFSDHYFPDAGDVLHREFINENAKRYDNDKVTHIMKDEEFDLDQYNLNYQYNEALDDLDANIESRITYWIKKADRYLKRPAK